MAHRGALLVICFSALLFTCQAGFFDLFRATWGGPNIHPNDLTNSVEVSLTADGMGATFDTNNTYLFGSFSAQIKLVPGNSAGTVAAFFLISDGNASVHDEIDFEFLGNVSGQPYLLHTNLFANGTGNREQDTNLWFDPTADFHTYRIVWNHNLVMWLVDEIPVRVYHNIENIAPLSFPTLNPMLVSGCIFEASEWATEGGAVPIDYSYAPFNANFQNFTFDACVATSDGGASCGTNYAGNSWELPPYDTFGSDRENQLAWVRQYYLHYDYCYDTERYPTPPIECQYNL